MVKYEVSVVGRIHKLTINRVDSRDAGDYAIVVKGHRSAARMSVEAKPSFLDVDKYSKPLVLRAGQSSVIEIGFSGAPQPKATWMLDGQRLLESRRVTTDTIYGMTSLTIGRAERGDAGRYTLKVDNTFGSAEINIDVKVLDKPGPPRDLDCSEAAETSVTLEWSAPRDDGGSPVTDYLVQKREVSC